MVMQVLMQEVASGPPSLACSCGTSSSCVFLMSFRQPFRQLPLTWALSLQEGRHRSMAESSATGARACLAAKLLARAPWRMVQRCQLGQAWYAQVVRKHVCACVGRVGVRVFSSEMACCFMHTSIIMTHSAPSTAYSSVSASHV